MVWWEWQGMPTAEEWSAFWGFGTFAVAGIAAVIALRQFRAYIDEKEERARPYVIADFWFKGSTMLYIVIQNISNTPATNVRLVSSPLPQSTRGDRNAGLSGVFDGKLEIPQLAPDSTMRWYVDTAAAIFASTAVPHRFEIAVSYTDPRVSSRRRGRSEFADKFILDLDAFGQASGEDNYDNKNWNIANRNESTFKDIRDAVKSIASALGDETGRWERRRRPVHMRDRKQRPRY